MPMIENFSEFCDRQGCEHLYEDRRSISLFSNGSSWSHDGKFGIEPPFDVHANFAAIIDYFVLKVEKAEANLFNVTESIASQVDFARRGVGALPTDAALECRKLLQRDLKAAREELAEARSKVMVAPLNAHKAEVEKARFERREAATNLMQELMKETAE
ncbi:MAG: hypothetical protein ACYC3X_22115 [Pirellulaceae bacterium]